MARLDPLLRELAKCEQGTLVLDPGCQPQLGGGGQERDVFRSVLQSEQIAALVRETAPQCS